MKNIWKLKVLTLLLIVAVAAGCGDDGANGLDGLAGADGKNGKDGQDGVTLAGETADGNIKATLEGTAFGKAFKEVVDFKYSPLSDEGRFYASVRRTDDDDYTYEVLRNATASQVGNRIYFGLVVDRATSAVTQVNLDLQMRWVMDGNKLADARVDFMRLPEASITGLKYDAVTHRLSFKYSTTLGGADNGTGEPLTVSGEADVVVYDILN